MRQHGRVVERGPAEAAHDPVAEQQIGRDIASVALEEGWVQPSPVGRFTDERHLDVHTPMGVGSTHATWYRNSRCCWTDAASTVRDMTPDQQALVQVVQETFGELGTVGFPEVWGPRVVVRAETSRVPSTPRLPGTPTSVLKQSRSGWQGTPTFQFRGF